MTPDQKAELIMQLHATYCARSSFDILLNDQRRRMWWDWCSFASWTWTKDDLGRVIGYLLSQIRIDKRNEGALKFTNLIGQPDKFEEDLGLAKKAAKPNRMFVAKPEPVKPVAGQPVNSFGEAVEVGPTAGEEFRNLFQKP